MIANWRGERHTGVLAYHVLKSVLCKTVCGSDNNAIKEKIIITIMIINDQVYKLGKLDVPLELAVIQM